MAVINQNEAQGSAAPNPLSVIASIRSRVPEDPGREALTVGLGLDFAKLNGVKESPVFTLDAVVRGLRSGGKWGALHEWPACRHVHFFKRGGRASLVIAQPYASPEVEALRRYAAEHGLVFQTPPNPKASFWFPGSTLFIALTAPSFGPVRWLDAQLEYEETPS